MSKRKTIRIEALKAQANKVFRESADDYTEGRKHIATFVNDLSHQTGQYKGFGYLSQRQVAPGKTFGIEFVNNTPVFHDQTRIELF